MRMIHRAMKMVVWPLKRYERSGFNVKTREGVEWRCVPLLVSYCCDIPEGKDISGVRHGVAVRRPCVRCMVTGEDIIAGRRSDIRSMEDTRRVRRIVCSGRDGSDERDRIAREGLVVGEGESGSALLKSYSLSKWPSFLEEMMGRGGKSGDVYSIFTFEPLHNLHLGISKLVKECTMSYLSSDRLMTGGGEKGRKPFVKVRTRILRGCNALLATIEREGEVPGVRIDFGKVCGTSGLDGIFTKNGLKGMLEGRDYKGLDKVFPFVAAFIDRCTGHERTAPMTRVHTMYSEIVNEVTGDGEYKIRSEEELVKLEERVKEFKRELVERFDDHCESGLYTLKFHLLDHMVEDIRKFGTLSVLDGSPFEHFNVHIKQAYRKTSQRRSTRMMETVGVIERRYDGRCGYVGEKGNGRMGMKGERRMRLERSGPYLVRDGERLGVDEVARAVEEGVGGRSGVSFANKLVELFGASTMKTYCALVREIDSERGRNVTDAQIRLVFVKSGYLLGGRVPTLKDVDYVHGMIKEGGEYERRVQRVFASDNFGTSGVCRNSYVLVSGGGYKGEGLWVAKVLLLFRMNLGGEEVGKEYAFLQYMEVSRPVDVIEETLNCVCLRWSTDDEVDYSCGGGRNGEKRGRLQVGEWFGIEELGTLKGCVNVIRSNHAIEPFTKRLAWPYRRFYVNRFHVEGYV